MNTLLKHDLMRLVRNRSSLTALALILLAGIYALYYGQAKIRFQQADLQKVLAAERETIQKQMEAFAEESSGSRWNKMRTVANPPSPLAALAIGQRDVFPYYKTVRAYGLYGGIFASELANPLKLLTGNFDLSFVLIFLLPLLIVALCYNLLSEERENGSLALILSNPVSLHQLVLTRLLARFLIVTVLILLLFGIGVLWAGIPLDTEAWIWLASVLVYTGFWFAVSFWVISLQKSSAFSSLALVGCWLLLVVIAPALANLYLEATHPVAKASEVQRELRDINSFGWGSPRQPTIERYFAANPALRVDTLQVNPDTMFEVAAMHLMDEDSRPHFAEYKDELAGRIRLSAALSWFSPATLTQFALNSAAGSDTPSYLAFLEEIESFYSVFKGFFDSKDLSTNKFGKQDFEKIPSYSPSAERRAEGLVGLSILLAWCVPFAVMGHLKLKTLQ